jgi:hypothetical protein
MVALLRNGDGRETLPPPSDPQEYFLLRFIVRVDPICDYFSVVNSEKIVATHRTIDILVKN